MEIIYQIHAPTALYPEKQPPVPITEEDVWTPEATRTLLSTEKYLAPAGNQTLAFQPVFLRYFLLFLFISILGGGVHTGSTRHCGHYWPILPAPGDCEDGEVSGMNGFGRGNRISRRKPAPTPLFLPQIPLFRPGREPGPPRWEASDQPLLCYTDWDIPENIIKANVRESISEMGAGSTCLRIISSSTLKYQQRWSFGSDK
jgi:hypothetical protein